MRWFDTTLASGVFKFSNKINPEMLADFLRDTWASDPAFLELSIRGCDGEKKHGIVFKYRHAGDKEGFARFMDLCCGRLTRVFHKDFVGWDASSSTYVIKPEVSC